ncbi:MAG: polysaccharide deacetylase family protein [bacterium]|nr:polysaccharide deacetylase family protein [bacterium]
MKYAASILLVVVVISTGILVAASGRAPGVDVLCYHYFLGNKNQYSFSYEELRKHIQYFRKKGYTFVTLSSLVQGKVKGGKNILLSIDDGNSNIYDTYYRVLKPLQIKPLLAIYPSVISKKKNALTWKQLKELADDGCGIAAHGYTHRFMTQKFYNADKKFFYNEIVLPKKILERRLGKTINTFVYPYGVRSAAAIKAVQKAGYRYALTIDPGTIPQPLPAGKSRYELPRYMVTRHNRKKLFAAITGKPVLKKPVVAAMRKKNDVDIRQKEFFSPETEAGREEKVSLPVNQPVFSETPVLVRHVSNTDSLKKLVKADPLAIQDGIVDIFEYNVKKNADAALYAAAESIEIKTGGETVGAAFQAFKEPVPISWPLKHESEGGLQGIREFYLHTTRDTYTYLSGLGLYIRKKLDAKKPDLKKLYKEYMTTPDNP